MNILLCCLIGVLCGILFFGVIFIVMFLSEISASLRRLRGTFDYYFCEFLCRFDESKSFDFDDKDEE